MTVEVKICGIRDRLALEAALVNGASSIGFVFYQPSKNAIGIDAAAALLAEIPASIEKVGLFVDPSDNDIAHVLATLSLDLLQLHGNETVERVRAIKANTSRRVMKALKIKTADQLSIIGPYEAVADKLLFDSRSGNESSGGPLDWQLLSGRHFSRPWMLAGGLTARNVAEAIEVSGARAVDVSSGVEDETGQKSPTKIRAFIEAARSGSVPLS